MNGYLRLFITIIFLKFLMGYAQIEQGHVNLEGLPVDESFKKFQFGLNFNPLTSWMKPDNKHLQNTGNELGYRFGLMADFSFTKNYALSTGIQISHPGGNLKQPSVIIQNGVYYQAVKETEYKLKRIEIPLLFKLRTNAVGWLVYYGKFGVSTDLNYQAKSDNIITATVNGEQLIQTDNKVDEADNLSLVALALVVGGGVEYNISGNTNIMLGLTFHNGFTNALNYKLLKTGSNGKVKISSNGVQYEEDAKAVLNYVSLDVGVYF